MEESLHVVVSRMNGATWMKVSRPVSRLELAGLMSEALYMCNTSDCSVVKPEDCSLPVILSVDESKQPPENS